MVDYAHKTLNELLSYEVAQIDDVNIRLFVTETLKQINPIHAVKPASSTGKYHPKYASGEGGLIRHIKVVVHNVIELIRATPAVEREKDELIAAAILHDMWKYPVGRDNEYTAFDHPALGAQYCKEHGQETIGRLIGAHQGIWTTSRQMVGFENAKPEKFDEYILHYADYFASKAYLACDFDESGELVLDPWTEREIKTSRKIVS